jgi:proteic killer suppression protein
MELSFRTRILRSVCEDVERAASTYGSEFAKHLKSRLADLRAAPTVLDLVVGRPIFNGSDKAELRISITDDFVLHCRPNHSSLPIDQDGAVDWRRIHRLQVIDIEALS